jgi:hypothetical protein
VFLKNDHLLHVLINHRSFCGSSKDGSAKLEFDPCPEHGLRRSKMMVGV